MNEATDASSSSSSSSFDGNWTSGGGTLPPPTFTQHTTTAAMMTNLTEDDGPIVTTSTLTSMVTTSTLTSMVSFLVTLTNTSVTNSTTQAPGPPVYDEMPWDNPDIYITRATQRTISLVLLGGLLPPLLLVGLPGNILTAAVFARQGLGNKVNLLLTCLALSDIIYLIAATFPGMHVIARAITPEGDLFPHYHNPELLWTSSCLHLISSLVMTLVAVDRCLTMTLPLGKTGLTTGHVACILVLIVVVSVLVHVPRFMMHVSGYQLNSATNLTYIYMQPTDLYDDVVEAVPNDVINADGVILKPIYLLTTLLCTIVIALRLRQAMRARSQMMTQSAGERDALRISRMLMAQCLAFIVCSTPNAVLMALNFQETEFVFFGRHHNSFLVTYHFNIVSMNVNSSVNFFIFCAMGSKFRKTLVSMLPCLAPLLKHSSKLSEAASSRVTQQTNDISKSEDDDVSKSVSIISTKH